MIKYTSEFERYWARVYSEQDSAKRAAYRAWQAQAARLQPRSKRIQLRGY